MKRVLAAVVLILVGNLAWAQDGEPKEDKAKAKTRKEVEKGEGELKVEKTFIPSNLSMLNTASIGVKLLLCG